MLLVFEEEQRGPCGMERQDREGSGRAGPAGFVNYRCTLGLAVGGCQAILRMSWKQHDPT